MHCEICNGCFGQVGEGLLGTQEFSGKLGLGRVYMEFGYLEIIYLNWWMLRYPQKVLMDLSWGGGVRAVQALAWRALLMVFLMFYFLKELWEHAYIFNLVILI